MSQNHNLKIHNRLQQKCSHKLAFGIIVFDIGFSELIVTCLVTLLVLGPKKLPTAIKFFILCTYKLRSFMQNISDKVTKEFDTDNIKLDIYNEQVMRNMQKNEQDSSNNLKDNDQNRS